MDNIIIYTDSYEEHIKAVEEILNTLQNVGLAINFSKCEFAKTGIRYIGIVVQKEAIKLDPERIKNFKYQVLKNKKQFSRLLSLINWFRSFLRNIVAKTYDLTDMTKESKNFKWEARHTQIVNDIFDEIKQETLLYFPEVSEKFTLTTDASEFVIGASLWQGNKLVGLNSKVLNDTERKHPIAEKEALSIIRALENFRNIIFAVKKGEM